MHLGLMEALLLICSGYVILGVVEIGGRYHMGNVTSSVLLSIGMFFGEIHTPATIANISRDSVIIVRQTVLIIKPFTLEAFKVKTKRLKIQKTCKLGGYTGSG